jgi:hypothetical protein
VLFLLVRPHALKNFTQSLPDSMSAGLLLANTVRL